MNITIENILFVGSLLLLSSILLSRTTYRFGIPILLLFLFIGMLAGSEGIGGIYFDSPEIAQFIGIVALNVILFSGGLDTQWNSVKPILREGISLSTLGVFFTTITTGFFVYGITDFTLYESLLLGAIVSSTDAAAVFSILRSKSLALKSPLRPALEFESGSNDPMAYALMIAFLSLVMNPERSLLSVVPLFLQEMILGGMAGFVFGWLSKHLINHIKLAFEGLYPVLVIALMLITFSVTDFIHGNGFLAIYICAVYLGNQNIMHKKTILKMYDGLAWLMQIVLFITLGLLVFPSEIWPVAGIGLLVAMFLIFIARPVSILLSLLPFRMKLRKQLYLSWVGLRGAVPIVFATYPLIAGIEKADMIFNIVFFISVTSVVIQGTTLIPVSKWLHVALPGRVKPVSDTERFLYEFPKNKMREITISPDCFAVKKRIVDMNFPKNTIIAMIKREEKYITPNGSTVLEANDILLILSDDNESLEKINLCIHKK